MELILVLCGFFFMYSFLKFFSKKLLCLLYLEGLMLSCVFSVEISLGASLTPLMLMVIFSVFLVLDSVLGVSLIIVSGRERNSNFLVF